MQTLFEPVAPWSASKKLLFRFCFLYFAVYIFFTPNNELPFVNTLYEGLNELLHQFIPWFAKHFFGYKKAITVFTNGSGDTTYDYLLWFFGIVVTLAGTLLWTLLDRKRPGYNTLHYWIRALIRYYLFYTMVNYGLFKVIKVQFPFPGLVRLAQPYGDSSPMGLAWTYMGYSTTYNYFTGFAELLAGVLLLFRKTTTVGAIVCLGVMTNVFMINMGYDVPVKLLSFNTILMSLFLLWPDAVRLANFFVLNRATVASNIALPYVNRKLRYGLLAVKVLFAVFIVWTTTSEALKYQNMQRDNAARAPLYGIYYTDTFIRNNTALPPLDTDTTRWKRIIISYKNYASIRLMNDTNRTYNFKVDTIARTALVYPSWDTLNKARFNYTKDSAWLTLTGKMNNDSVYIKLKRFDEKNFRLVSRGFNWVNEYPYNR